MTHKTAQRPIIGDYILDYLHVRNYIYFSIQANRLVLYDIGSREVEPGGSEENLQPSSTK